MTASEHATELLDALENMARQHCCTRRADRDYNEVGSEPSFARYDRRDRVALDNGQVAGTMVTDSGALSADADALETLAQHGRFRVVAGSGRMVVGYWPENDPEKMVPWADWVPIKGMHTVRIRAQRGANKGCETHLTAWYNPDTGHWLHVFNEEPHMGREIGCMQFIVPPGGEDEWIITHVSK